MQFQTPILFITFARPEYAQSAFSQIRKAKPQKLYFYSNKGRDDIKDEISKNDQVRELVTKIDWPCNVKTFFQNSHVDIYTSLFSAIDWIFENEEQAIILEEDCVASQAFFSYCELLLNKYRDNLKVWMISGNNFTEKGYKTEYDYIFSNFSHIYGWASWKNRWTKLDRNMKTWQAVKSEKIFYKYFHSTTQALFVETIFENFYNGLQDTPAWDYLFWYTTIINNAYTIFPKKHLVGNIGIIGHHNSSGTMKYFNIIPELENHELSFNNDPLFIFPDTFYDKFHFENHINKTKSSNLFFKIYKKAKRAFYY